MLVRVGEQMVSARHTEYGCLTLPLTLPSEYGCLTLPVSDFALPSEEQAASGAPAAGGLGGPAGQWRTRPPSLDLASGELQSRLSLAKADDRVPKRPSACWPCRRDFFRG
jgi:hypothetical protein